MIRKSYLTAAKIIDGRIIIRLWADMDTVNSRSFAQHMCKKPIKAFVGIAQLTCVLMCPTHFLIQ